MEVAHPSEAPVVAEHNDEKQSYGQLRVILLRRDELQRLTHLRPGIALRDTVIVWLQIGAAWSIAAWYPAAWCIALMACLVGNRYYSLFIIGHDGLHRRLHGTPAINDWWNDIFLIGPLGAVTRLNRRNHMRHHATLALSQDPDNYKYRRRDTNGLLFYLWALTGLPLVWRAVHNVYAGIRSGAVVPDRQAAPAHGTRDLCIIAAWQVTLIGGLTLVFGWWGYLVMWLGPVYVFTFATDILRVFCEHSVLEVTDEECHLKDRLVTFRSSWLERQLFAPMNMNHHVAHHLWPSIPYYNLPQATKLACARAALRAGHEGPALLTWRDSYVGYLHRCAVAAWQCHRRGRHARSDAKAGLQ